MAQNQKLSEGQLLKLEGQIDTVVANMNKQLRELENLLDATHPHWKGAGAGGFTKAQTEMNRHHSRLKKILAGLRDAVEETRKGGSANDHSVAGQMRGAQGGPGASYGDTGHDSLPYSKLQGIG